MIGRFLGAAVIGAVGIVVGLALLVHLNSAAAPTVGWVTSVARQAGATVASHRGVFP